MIIFIFYYDIYLGLSSCTTTQLHFHLHVFVSDIIHHTPCPPTPFPFPFLCQISISTIYIPSSLSLTFQRTLSMATSGQCRNDVPTRVAFMVSFPFTFFYLFLLFLYLSTSPFSLLLTILCTLFPTLARSHCPCAVVVFLNDLGVGLLPFLAFCTCAVEMKNYLLFYLFLLYSTSPIR